MPYKCIHGGLTRPCIYDPQYDKDLSEEGRRKGKKKYRTARKGDVFEFVCPISRKYFVATDEASRKQDKADLATISAELKSLGVKVPPDATVWEAAINLSEIKTVERKKKERNPTRKFERMATPAGAKQADEPEPEKAKGATVHEEPDLQKQELRAWLKEHNVKYNNFDSLPKLKQLKKNAEARG